jgi:hypothetical protein
MKKISLIAFIIAATLPAHTAELWACAVCLGGDDAGDGYNASLLFLLSTPYTVVGAIVAGLVFQYRRTRRHGETAAESDATINLAWKQEESSR